MRKMLIINDDIQVPNKHEVYRWDNRYILPYETRASIQERFKLFNYVKGSKQTQQVESDLIDWSANCYTENTVFDDYDRGHSFRFFMLSTSLRYCPECARYGYISYFHLNRLFDKCFVHNRKLEELHNVPAQMSMDKDYPYCYNEKGYFEELGLCSVADIVAYLPKLKKTVEAAPITYLDRYKRIALFSYDQSDRAIDIFRKLIDGQKPKFCISHDEVPSRYDEIIRHATEVFFEQRLKEPPKPRGFVVSKDHGCG